MHKVLATSLRPPLRNITNLRLTFGQEKALSHNRKIISIQYARAERAEKQVAQANQVIAQQAIELAQLRALLAQSSKNTEA